MDFGWFFRIPGLFITGGVVLIIIALIVFLLGSKKGKAEEVKEELSENVPESVPEVNNTDAPVNTDTVAVETPVPSDQ